MTNKSHEKATSMKRHPMEDDESWSEYLKRRNDGVEVQDEHEDNMKRDDLRHRQLRHHHNKKDAMKTLEEEKEAKYWKQVEADRQDNAKTEAKLERKHEQALQELWRNPSDIDVDTVHGMMIDAGSTGSRLHVYEWEPRVLRDADDIAQAVSGNKLSFPGTEHRWTARLRPGLSEFGDIEDDDELVEAVAKYLEPLLDFAKAVLHSKEARFAEFPIYLRATAGMRILNPTDRARIMTAVRSVFSNTTYSPFAFAFTDEQARVLSGEEESIYDWTGVNFLMGDLLQASAGAGTVVNPKQTFGALDLGGGSTQIGFYEPHEDVMANLFKLQIGQSKHWNVYSHSFLYYGMNEAINRMQARLVSDHMGPQERLVDGIYNPCLPGGTHQDVRDEIHVTSRGMETFNYTATYPSGNGNYQAVLKNDQPRGDAEACMALAKDLLHLEKNDWCDFAHGGDCSFAGIYQPRLPSQEDEHFGEFIGFSNYYHVWNFLDLPERATLSQLQDATNDACNLSRDELLDFVDGRFESDELDSYCFRSAYVFQLLRNGYGFQMTDSIRAVRVINGHKVGWALGAMLYEINTLPWTYARAEDVDEDFVAEAQDEQRGLHADKFLMGVLLGLLAVLSIVFISRRRRRRARFAHEYEPIKEVEETEIKV